MERQLERCAEAVAGQTRDVAALAESLSEVQFSWRPDEGRWSISQHLTHLAKTTDGYLRAIEDAMEDARSRGLVRPGPYRGRLLGRLFVRSMAPPVRIRVRTFAILEPQELPTKEEAVAAFTRSQEELGRALARADGIDLGRATVRSPFLRRLKLSLGQAFEAIVVHNARHLWHIEQLRRDPRFPGPEPAGVERSPPTTKGTPMNRPVHFEILTDDPERSTAFYEAVFGWQVATWEGPQNYWLVTTGSEGTPGIDGGIMHRHFPQPVINTISVSSLEETIQRVETNGGQKVFGPNEIPGVGTHVYCSDPDGTLFGLLQPADRATGSAA